MAFDSVVPPEHPLAIELRELIHDRRLLDFFERAVDGIWFWDLTEDGTSYVSPAFGRVFGYEPWEYEQGAAFWKGICHPDDWAASMAAIQAAIAADEPYDMTVRMRHKDGTWRWSRSVGLILRDETGQPQRGFGLHHDVTGLMRAQALLEREAIHDPLTELLNRRGIEQALEDILAHVQRLDCEAYALFIDLDNFKQVNDQHGHATGDQVLRATAHTIQHAVRVVDAVGRLGGDEFLLFLLARDRSEAERIAQRVTDAVRSQQGPVPVTASSALLPVYADGPRHTCVQTLLRAAAPYLQRSKHNGKDQTSVSTLRPPASK